MTKQQSKKNARQERRARVEQMREQDAKTERRRNVFIAVITLLLVALIIGASVWAMNNGGGEGTVEGIDDLQSFDGLTSDHVDGSVDSQQIPPVGGDHAAAPQNCGVYTEPIANENAVHSLEHGAVWIAYQPQLADKEIAALEDVARRQPYVLVSPYPELPAPVVLSAWGKQLSLDDAADPRLNQFIETFVNGPQTPEPGAACDGGVGQPG
jgi:hypothetical protein